MTPKEVFAQYGDLVRGALRPALALRPDPRGSGRSRLRGDRALLRVGELWPTYRGETMILLAQVDFSECVEFPVEGLPLQGVLQAFITAEEPVWEGESPITGEGPTRLRILTPDESLVWGEDGSDDPGFGVRFEFRQTLPEATSEALTEDEDEAIREAFPNDGHQILGDPYPLQSDVLEDFDPEGRRILALQIDSDEVLGWNWVDTGMLFFLADGEAFARGEIAAAIFHMQFC